MPKVKKSVKEVLVVEPQQEQEPEPEPEPEPVKKSKRVPKVNKDKVKKPKVVVVKKKKVKKTPADKGLSLPLPTPEVEPLPLPELELVEEVVETVINNPKSKRHGKKVKRVVKQLKEQVEWLELDYSKVSDNDLEELNVHAQKYQPEGLGIDFMHQLLARGSTVETAKKKWSQVHKSLKTDKDLIKLMKKSVDKN